LAGRIGQSGPGSHVERRGQPASIFGGNNLTIFGDEALQPDAAIEAEIAGLTAIGMSPQTARNVARASKLRDLANENERKVKAAARAERVASMETAFFMATRTGVARTPQQLVADAAVSMDNADLIAAAAERRREVYPAPSMIGEMAGRTEAIPAPQSPASKRARVAQRAKQILAGSKSAKRDTPEEYAAAYCRQGDVSYRDSGNRHISVR
jgi:hypothetical protein